MFLGLFLLAPAFAASEKAAKFYEDALVRFEKKDLDGAIIQLKNALQIDNSLLPVQLLLGKALLQNGDVVAAEVALMEALSRGVNRAEVVIPLGRAYIAQGKHKLIFEQQQFSLTGLPPAVQVQLLLLRSSALADLGDGRGAVKAVDDARAIDPRSPAVSLAEVPIRIRGGQFREATAAVERALALAPESAEAWYQKGSILHVVGDRQAAIAAYDRALKLDATHVEALVVRAGLSIDLGRPADAAKDLDSLKEISPDEPRAAYLRALLAERNKQPEVMRAALMDVTGLIDPVPFDFIRYRPQLLMLNGLAHYALNEPQKAKQFLEAFQKVQGNTPASKLLAQVYLAESKTDRAVEVLEIYLKAQPNDGQAMTLLASALMANGQNARATSLMQRALETKDAPEYRTALGLSLLRGGQTASAMTELGTAFKRDPSQTQAATSLIALYLRAGLTAKAVTLAEQLVKQQPGNAGFFNLLGTAQGKAGNLPAAKVAYEQAIKLDDTLVVAKIGLARIETASGAYDAATQRLAAILKVDEKNAEALFQMAALSERRGQGAETQRWLEKATDASARGEVRWGLALSDFHLRNGRPGPALEAVKRVAGKAPDDLSLHLAYARAQLANGDAAGARSSLSNATRVAEFNPASQVQIALLQLQANNLPGAAYSLQKALSGEPDFLPAMALMAEVELRQGEPAKAEKRARDIVAANPKRAIGHSLLGDIALARGQSADALAAYRRAHQIEPSTETLLRLFRALAGQDGGKPAMQLAVQWLKTHPGDALAQKALADAYARSGNLSAARKAYESLLTIKPDDSEALNNLANVLLRLKDPGAAKIAEQAVARNPGNADAIDTLGWILFKAGQTDRALQLLRDARLREPANPEIRFHLAVALTQTGRKAEAREELEAALKSTRRFESAADAEQLLRSLR